MLEIDPHFQNNSLKDDGSAEGLQWSHTQGPWRYLGVRVKVVSNNWVPPGIRGGLAVVGKHVCSDSGLISTLPAPKFGQGSISPLWPGQLPIMKHNHCKDAQAMDVWFLGPDIRQWWDRPFASQSSLFIRSTILNKRPSFVYFFSCFMFLASVVWLMWVDT